MIYTLFSAILKLQKTYDFFHELKPICIMDNHNFLKDENLETQKRNKGHYPHMKITGWGYTGEAGLTYEEHLNWRHRNSMKKAELSIWPSNKCHEVMNNAATGCPFSQYSLCFGCLLCLSCKSDH